MTRAPSRWRKGNFSITRSENIKVDSDLFHEKSFMKNSYLKLLPFDRIDNSKDSMLDLILTLFWQCLQLL